MSRKLASLAALLAIAALALIPATSVAATPHWFKAGKRQAEGVKVPFMIWGGPVDLAMEEPVFTQCRTVAAGYIENPKGTGTEVGEKGPAGAGQILSFNSYECQQKSCEEGIAREYGALGYKGVGFLAAYNFPWSVKLQGSETIEEKLGAKPDAGTGQSWGKPSPANRKPTPRVSTRDPRRRAATAPHGERRERSE